MKQSMMLKQQLLIRELELKLKAAKKMVDELLAENKKLVDQNNAQRKES